jgi:hypothetical protein
VTGTGRERIIHQGRYLSRLASWLPTCIGRVTPLATQVASRQPHKETGHARELPLPLHGEERFGDGKRVGHRAIVVSRQDCASSASIAATTRNLFLATITGRGR